MNRDLFLRTLREGLSQLPTAERDEIVADYTAHFDDAKAAGRSEEEVAVALGDPARLARECRAEAGLRRWESRRSPATFFAALVALGGLAAFDVFFLLPLLGLLSVVLLIVAFVLAILCLVGAGLLLSALASGFFHPFVTTLMRALTGLGLVAGGIGSGAFLILALNIAVNFLGSYARLHYRLLKPQPAAV